MLGLIRHSVNFSLRSLAPMASAAGLSGGLRSISATPVARGLEDFFDKNSAWVWRQGELPTGKPWEAAQLRQKSFEDLHRLWWVCLKEVNKLASQTEEAKRFNLFFPHRERLGKVQRTMKLLKSVVWERKIAFEQAQAVLQKQRLQESLEADQSKTPEEISKTLSAAFPRPIEDVGRDTTSRFRLQDRYKGAATERRKKAERVARKNPRTFIL